MNKKLAAFFAGYGMTVEKNGAHGVINGYETFAALQVFDNINPLKLHISFYATDEQKRSIEAALRNAAIKRMNFEITAYGILIGLSYLTLNKLLQGLPALFDKIYGILKENGALGNEFCPVCGERLAEKPTKICNINELAITIDEKCVDTINSVIDEENREFNNAPNNYLKGFLGAVLGGAVGVVLAIIISLLGYVASISSVVAVLVGCLLYKKLGGKPNKMMLVIVGVTVFVMMLASEFVIYIIIAGAAAKEEGLDMTAFEAFSIVMKDAEFARLFYLDLALTAVFSIIGIVAEVLTQYRNVKRRGKL